MQVKNITFVAGITDIHLTADNDARTQWDSTFIIRTHGHAISRR